MSDLVMPSGNDAPQVLLEHHLKQLRLPTFLRECDEVARERAAAGELRYRKDSPRARPGFIGLPTRASRALHDGVGDGARVAGSQGRKAAAALPETDGQLRTADRR